MKKIILLLIMALGFQLNAEAQIFKKLRKRIERKAENRAEDYVEKKTTEKVEKEVDKSLDQVEESLDEMLEAQNEEQASQDTDDAQDQDDSTQDVLEKMKQLQFSMQNVELKDQYDFDMRITVEINSEGQEMTTIQYFGKDGMMMQMPDQEDQFTILDHDSEATIMLDKKNKTYTAISLKGLQKWAQDAAENQDSNNPNQSLTKTGKHRTILGYDCEEYKFTDEEMQGFIWMTDEIEDLPESYFSNMQNNMKYGGKQAAAWTQQIPPNSFMLAMEMTEDNDKTMTMEIKEFSKVSKSINMKNYKSSNIMGK